MFWLFLHLHNSALVATRLLVKFDKASEHGSFTSFGEYCSSWERQFSPHMCMTLGLIHCCLPATGLGRPALLTAHGE